MSGKWFSNRGQIIQVACAVIAVAIGVTTQWNQISNAIDLALIVKIALYPLAVIILIQVGKHFPTANAPAPGQAVKEEVKTGPTSVINYQFLTPTVKIGSYFDVDQERGLRRISVISIQNHKVGFDEVPAVEIEVTGMVLNFDAGRSVKKVSDKRFLIPAYSRSIKDGDCSMHEFSYRKESFSLSAISVDHINVPAQEATLAICLATYRLFS
jgi:hypothetical protein